MSYNIQDGSDSRATMSALRVHNWGEVPRLDRVAIPSVKRGETLVKIEAAAVSHLDLTIISGKFNVQPQLPYIGGTDGAGIVVQSESFSAGSRVALRGGGLGIRRDGSWAEYVAVPDEAVRTVPHDLPSELAATIYSPLTTSYITLHDIARLGQWQFGQETSSEEVVVVTGASGAVGSVVVQLAMRAGVRVIAMVSSEASIPFVPPATEVVALSDGDRIAAILSDLPVSLLVDTIGGPRLGERISWVRPGGRAALLGYTAGTKLQLDLPNWFLESVPLLPVSMLFHERRARELIAGLTDYVTEGAIKVPVESHPLSRASAAFERLQLGAARGKVVLTM